MEGCEHQALKVSWGFVVTPVGIESTPDQMLDCTKQVLNRPVQIMTVGGQREPCTIGSQADRLVGVVGVCHPGEVGGGLDLVVVQAQEVGGRVGLLIPFIHDIVHVVHKLLPGCLLRIPCAVRDLQEHQTAGRYNTHASVQVKGPGDYRLSGF